MTYIGLLIAIVHKGRQALRIHPSSFQGVKVWLPQLTKAAADTHSPPRKLLPWTFFCKGCPGIPVGTAGQLLALSLAYSNSLPGFCWSPPLLAASTVSVV